MTKITPVKNNERELFMDALRGFAILGIFIANLGGFSNFNGDDNVISPWILGKADDIAEFFGLLFIEGKFYSIFSLLFGWGIALQFKRGEANNVNAAKTIRRRLLVMVLLGAIHLSIWIGDIVLFYALLGFILLPLRRFSNKTLLITGSVLILSPVFLYALKMHFPILNYPAQWLYGNGNKLDALLVGIDSEASYRNFEQTAGWWDYFIKTPANFCYRYGGLIFVSRIPKVLGMFMLGYVLGRSGFYQNFRQNKKTVKWIVGLGLIIGLPANFMLAYFMTRPGDAYYELKPQGWYETVAYALGVVPLALAYVGLLMLLFRKKLGNKMLIVLAPVGKMAFTNYMLQSLIGNFVFLNAGLGYGGQVGVVCYMLFGISVYIFQVVLSSIWLRYFQYGPVEWVWRSLTYGKAQQMLK